MSTDATSQTPSVIAKDLLIAALANKQLFLNTKDAVATAEDLGKAYAVLYKAVKNPA